MQVSEYGYLNPPKRKIDWKKLAVWFGVAALLAAFWTPLIYGCISYLRSLLGM